MRNIILASASPRRREILEKTGVIFSVIPSTGEEIITKTAPAEVVEELSKEKAASVYKKTEEDCLVIGADTVVAFENKILGKPRDEQDAVDTLTKLQGNTHQVYTGVTVLWKEGGRERCLTFSECTDVTFYPAEREEILAYVRTGDPMDKAGSYGVQGYFGSFVKRLEGDYFNVVGLPVGRLFYEMKKFGIDLRG